MLAGSPLFAASGQHSFVFSEDYSSPRQGLLHWRRLFPKKQRWR
jgi:hypothetical protein